MRAPYSPDEGVPSERARVEALNVLGVPRRAGPEEIRAAYLRLARELHPDLHPGDDERATRFQHVAAAYELLRRYYRRMATSRAAGRRAEQFDERWWSAFGHMV